MLAAHLRGAPVAPFTFEDFVFVGSKVSTEPERLILVGGQALETWGVVLEVPPPVGDGQPLTEDTDWLGSKRDAQWLCRQLGGDVDLQLAGEFDSGPSTGLARLGRPGGRVLLMDFLRAIVGPDPETVRRLAVQVRVQDITLNVMHPLLCLESRFANLEHIPSKRRGNGPMQAEWAIRIAHAFVKKALESYNKRDAIRACHIVAENAEYKSGRFCYLTYGLDPLTAVTPEIVAAIDGRFESDDWPRTVSRIEKKRARWKALDAERSAKRTAAD